MVLFASLLTQLLTQLFRPPVDAIVKRICSLGLDGSVLAWFGLHNCEEIDELQSKITTINIELKNSNLYIQNSERFNLITEEMVILKKFLETKENRWFELLKMQEETI